MLRSSTPVPLHPRLLLLIRNSLDAIAKWPPIESPIHARVYLITIFSRAIRKSLRESYVSCFVIAELQINIARFYRREIFRNRSLILSLSSVGISGGKKLHGCCFSVKKRQRLARKSPSGAGAWRRLPVRRPPSLLRACVANSNPARMHPGHQPTQSPNFPGASAQGAPGPEVHDRIHQPLRK